MKIKKKTKYENIKFKNKQRKNYIKKKNELIESHRIKRINDLESLTKNKNKNAKAYSDWSICYNVLNQYNRVVPNVHSKESLYNLIFNNTEKSSQNTEWEVSRSKFYFDSINKKKYFNKDEHNGNNTLLEYDYLCWKKI